MTAVTSLANRKSVSHRFLSGWRKLLPETWISISFVNIKKKYLRDACNETWHNFPLFKLENPLYISSHTTNSYYLTRHFSPSACSHHFYIAFVTATAFTQMFGLTRIIWLNYKYSTSYHFICLRLLIIILFQCNRQMKYEKRMR